MTDRSPHEGMGLLRRLVVSPGASRRMVCIPYAGGGVAPFHGWAAALPPTVEIWEVRLPGHIGRHDLPPERDLLALARSLATAVRAQPELPLVLFGHSMGALLALECARLLPSASLEAVIVSGRVGPSAERTRPRIAHLPDPDFVEELKGRYGGLPQNVAENAELMELFLPVLRADMAMVEGYRHRDEAPLSCPLHLFVGEDDPHTASAEGRETWRRETTGRFSCHRFAGGHFFIHSSRREVLRVLCRILDAAPVMRDPR